MPGERIAIVDDEPVVAKLLEYRIGHEWGYSVEVFAQAVPFLDRLTDPPDLVLLDLMLPDMNGVDVLKAVKQQWPDLPVIVLSAQAKIEVALETLKVGAADYFSKPVDFPKLEIAIKNALRIGALTREVQRLRENDRETIHFESMLSQSGEMQEVFRLVRKVKDSEIPVLVLGESGTGKELIARAIHSNSRRSQGPFVAVNCASIPHDLLESELFGHERGAFTGAAQRRIGKFELAGGGTIFLDEIGEMDPSLQAKILRVIQEKQFTRVGGNDVITSDARVISATNRDLREEVRQKRFREDLYYRLSTFPILLPPLRSRRSDILLLAEHFLRRFGSDHGKPDLRFSRKALDLLYAYPWPGNVRELENVIQRGVVLAEGNTFSEADLPVTIQSCAPTDPGRAVLPALFQEQQGEIIPLERLREEAIRHALQVTGGNIVEAARRLGTSRATLYRSARRFGIDT